MQFEVGLAEEIWTAKYRFAPNEGGGDSSFAETAERVSQAISEVEPAGIVQSRCDDRPVRRLRRAQRQQGAGAREQGRSAAPSIETNVTSLTLGERQYEWEGCFYR